MTLKEVLKAGCERLCSAGIDEARTECEHMLMQLLQLSRSDALHRMNSGEALRVHQEEQFFAWIQAREKRIPLAYLLGDVFFHSLKLKVGPGCLIPRPETELLVEAVAMSLKGKKHPLILDVGCGSGAIGLALLNQSDDANAVLIDVSNEALEIALTNARELNLEKRAEFILSDLFSCFELPSDDGQMPEKRKFDVIVSNPPYLTREDMNTLQPEVAHEPRLALDGGLDGLDFYRRIVRDAGPYLKAGGCLGLEVGAGQSQEICGLLEKAGYSEIKVFKDHQGIERTILGRNGG